MCNHLQTVIDSVNKILNDTNLTATDKVVERLVSLGYNPTDEDVWMIAFTMQKANHHILNTINHSTIPEGLIEVFVDMVCGEVLLTMYQTGKLELDSLDLDGLILSVSEGDTSVSFDKEGSDEAKLNNLLTWLMQGKGSDFLCYQKCGGKGTGGT